MDRLSHARLLVECNRLDDAAALLSVRATGINSSADAKLLLAQLAYKQGNVDAAETHLNSIGSSYTGHMHKQQQVLQQQLAGIRPLLHAVEAALTAGAWQTAREQAAACLDTLKPAASSVPGLAVRLLLLQATASAHLQDHEDSIQVRTPGPTAYGSAYRNRL